MLEARVAWNKREQEFLAILLERARDDRQALTCAAALRAIATRNRARSPIPTKVLPCFDPAKREEYAAWRRHLKRAAPPCIRGGPCW